jgi:diguanylate cyclase (GGDEF)-like protein
VGANFAFFLPIMMAAFGIAFLFMWRCGARAAAWWSAGFFSVAAGFAMPFLTLVLPWRGWAYVADIVFANGFLLFGQALLARWRPGWLLGARLAIWAGSLLACMAAIEARDLAVELVASDMGCFLLIAIPLIAAKGRLRAVSDRVLLLAGISVSLDCLSRASTVAWTLNPGSSFSSTQYAFLMQALACMFGLFLALAALAACVSDMLARHVHDAQVDPLTSLLNRRGFEKRLDESGERSATGSIVVCDIDHFKAVNDMHGHAEGDRVIVTLADTLRLTAPAGALVARFGGEEFVLFLPGLSVARAAAWANEARGLFADEAGPALGLGRVLTASFGVSSRHPGDGSIHDAIDRADLALYEAKRQGRDRVCVQRAWEAKDEQVAPTPLARIA